MGVEKMSVSFELELGEAIRIAGDHDMVLTSDADDLRSLLRAAGSTAMVRRC